MTGGASAGESGCSALRGGPGNGGSRRGDARAGRSGNACRCCSAFCGGICACNYASIADGTTRACGRAERASILWCSNGSDSGAECFCTCDLTTALSL